MRKMSCANLFMLGLFKQPGLGWTAGCSLILKFHFPFTLASVAITFIRKRRSKNDKNVMCEFLHVSRAFQASKGGGGILKIMHIYFSKCC